MILRLITVTESKQNGKKQYLYKFGLVQDNPDNIEAKYSAAVLELLSPVRYNDLEPEEDYDFKYTSVAEVKKREVK